MRTPSSGCGAGLRRRVPQDSGERRHRAGRAATAVRPDTLAGAGGSGLRRGDGAGAAALREGEIALVVLAGGMATRFGGGVKATAEALDGMSFLEVKLRRDGAAA